MKSIVHCLAKTCLLVMCGTMAARAQQSEVDALKEELKAMRAAYEAQITALESRIDKLETQESQRQTEAAKPAPATAADFDAAITRYLVKAFSPAPGSQPYSFRSFMDIDSAVSNQFGVVDSRTESGPEFASRQPFHTGFDYQGYIRSGYGVNSRGGKMEAFKAPGALSKYRLGNEDDTYLEMRFNLKSWDPDSNGMRIEVPIRLAYSSNMDNNDSFTLGEVYVRVTHFSDRDPEMGLWAGRRFYRLPEPHMNDFWFYDLSGYGGGLDTISLGGNLKLALAYIGYSDQDDWYNTQNGLIAKNNLNAILYGIDLFGGQLTTWVNYGYLKGGNHYDIDSETMSDYKSYNGFDLGFMHVIAPDKTFKNQFSTQFGYGANISLSAGAILPVPAADGSGRYGYNYDQDAWTVRFINDTLFQWTDRLGMEAVGLYQYTDRGNGNQYNWASCGVRPVWQFSRYFGIELEPGIDYVDDQATGDSSYLFKGTIALRCSPNGTYFSRPEIRLFATYAKWGSDFEGQVAPDSFYDKREGMNFGIQAEYWW